MITFVTGNVFITDSCIRKLANELFYIGNCPESKQKLRAEMLITENDRNPVVFSYSVVPLLVFRVAVRQGKLSTTDLKILFFKERGKNPIELQIDTDGRMSEWPDGFFDTTRRLLAELL